MKFRTIKDLKNAGFEGFRSVRELGENKSVIPDSMGVYMVVLPDGFSAEYLTVGTGGHFKDRDPNVSIDELRNNWVGDTSVVYIGKATSLRKRLGQYLRFGEGCKVGHWGGRYIWQLKNSNNLLFCWKVTPGVNSKDVESMLIQKFKDSHGGRLPFANLQG